jgi:ATP-binding protein involved in chromosome partitioning
MISGLQALADLPESGLGSKSEAAARLLGVHETPEGMRVDLASDGLGLDRKSFLERELTARVGGHGIDAGRLTIYFKRRDAPPKGVPPAPLKEKAAPFGLFYNKRAIPGVREVIMVASGKGGVGKSTVSSNLAVALAVAGARVGLLDADIYGPSAPMMLGLKGPLEVLGQDCIAPLVGHGVKCVSFGFLTDTKEPVIWRGPMIAKAVKQLCYNVAWGELDYLVVDLPPGTGDVQLALIESIPIHGALIVTTPQDVALLDAHKAFSMFERLEVPVLGLVENMSHYHCSKCGHAEPIFGEGGAGRMAVEKRVRVLAHIPLALQVRQHGDSGAPVALKVDGKISVAGKPFHDLAAQVMRPTR